MLNSTTCMSYSWCCNCMHRNIKCLPNIQQLRQRCEVMTIIRKDYSPVGWLITITANHSNYLVWWQSQHAVCHCQESGKTATQLLQCPRNCWIYNIVLFEGRTRDVYSSSLLIDVYALFSDVSLWRQASMTQAEKFRTLFAQERC